MITKYIIKKFQRWAKWALFWCFDYTAIPLLYWNIFSIGFFLEFVIMNYFELSLFFTIILGAALIIVYVFGLILIVPLYSIKKLRLIMISFQIVFIYWYWLFSYKNNLTLIAALAWLVVVNFVIKFVLAKKKK